MIITDLYELKIAFRKRFDFYNKFLFDEVFSYTGLVVFLVTKQTTCMENARNRMTKEGKETVHFRQPRLEFMSTK